MKIIDDYGRQYTVNSINGIVGEGDIILRTDIHLHPADILAYEKQFTEKFGRKVIVLDAKWGDIFTLTK
jgi:hypothetical protein